MRQIDMLKVLIDCPKQMTVKQREFVADMARLTIKGKILSPAQHQYLQSIYDSVITNMYKLEPTKIVQNKSRTKEMRVK